MRALSFKTGIACLCGTEVKEKFQCESLGVEQAGGSGSALTFWLSHSLPKKSREAAFVQ